jgi:putative MATE family efflux protein
MPACGGVGRGPGEPVVSGPGPTAAELRREVFRLAWPVIGEQMLYMAVNVVDTMIAGRVNEQVLAGLGMAAFLSWIMSVVLSAAAVGATALVARSVGARDLATARAAARQSLLLAAVAGGVLTAVCVAGGDTLMGWMGLTGGSAEYGAQWLRITGWAMIPFSITVVGSACLRGAGETRTPMWIMAFVNAVNLAVSLGLTFGVGPVPALGAVGIAVGTATARALGGLTLAALLAAGYSRLRVPLRVPAVDWAMLRRIGRVAAPAMVENVLGAASMVIYYRIVAVLGDVAVAAHSVAVRTEGLSYLPGWGFAVAAATLVGQNLGAGLPEVAQRAGRQAFLAGGSVMAAMGLVFLAAGEQLIAVFAPDQPGVIADGGAALRLACVGQLGQAATFIFCGALRGAGDTRYPLAVTLTGQLLVRLPLSWVFAVQMQMGLTGAWLAMVADNSVRGVLAWLRFRGGGWKGVKV